MTDNTPTSSGRTLRRQLSLTDLVFLSFGGQAALLSLLTYATGVIIQVGEFAPISIVIGTLIVLFNAMAVYGLSKRYGEAGGYYIYAFYSLTRRLGLETGWMYILYSVIYGSAYVAGSAYVLRYVLHIDPLLAALIVFIPAALFLITGIRPSARYAEVASIIEISVLAYIVISNLFIAGFRFYNPFSHRVISEVTPGLLAVSLLFAIGIPTGYGSITPLGGEAIRKEDVGKAAIIVVISGGLLTAAVIYTLIDASIMTHSINYVLAARVPVLDFLRKYYGYFAAAPLLFAAFNDGVLAPLSFMAATSRTIYAMAKNQMLPASLAALKGDHPFNSVIATVVLYTLTSIGVLAAYERPLTVFLVYGSIAGLANLFVHISGDFSYFLEGVRGLRRALTYTSLKSFKWVFQKVSDIIIAVIATAISMWALLSTFRSNGIQLELDIFVAWILIGFIYAEILDELQAYRGRAEAER